MTASMSPPPPPLSEKAATGCVLATAVPPATSRQTVGWSHSFFCEWNRLKNWKEKRNSEQSNQKKHNRAQLITKLDRQIKENKTNNISNQGQAWFG